MGLWLCGFPGKAYSQDLKITHLQIQNKADREKRKENDSESILDPKQRAKGFAQGLL